MSMTNHAQFLARQNKYPATKNSDSMTRFSHGPAPADPFLAPPISHQAGVGSLAGQGHALHLSPGPAPSHKTGPVTDAPDQMMKSIISRQSHGANASKVTDSHIDKIILDRIQHKTTGQQNVHIKKITRYVGNDKRASERGGAGVMGVLGTTTY